eukprot:GGOE01017869.1.p1 GENE.GGOE01017869.1~~GGOE01017869.1.p1  ORF type:complete len:1398 (-),score=365.16 GGOE01017869.1:200-4393(-)
MPYFAIGCPKEYKPRQVRPADAVADLGFSPCGNVLLVLTKFSIQFWSGTQHRMCLHTIAATPDQLDAEGHHVFGCWRPTSQSIAVATLNSHVVTYSTSLPGFAPGGPNAIHFDAIENVLHLPDLSQRVQRQAAVHLLYGSILRLQATAHHILTLTSLGHVVSIAWKSPGTLLQVLNSEGIARHVRFPVPEPPDSHFHPGNVVDWCFEGRIGLTAAVFADGRLAILQMNLSKLETIEFKGNATHPIAAVAAMLNAKHSLVAVALRNSDVAIYCVAGSGVRPAPYARLSLDTWAVPSASLGPVTALRWTQDEDMLCIGYENLGLALFHFTGPCLMSTVPKFRAGDHSPASFEAGIHAVAWDKEGYSLVVAAPLAQRFTQFAFCKNSTTRNPAQNTRGQIVLQAADKLLVVHMADTDFLPDNLEVVSLPGGYLGRAWPLQYVSVSEDGQHIAVAGARGCGLYSCGLKKWRMFTDEQEEFSIRCIAPIQWVGNVVIILPTFDVGRRQFQLALYPRLSLERAALLHQELLEHQPIRIDTAPLAGNESAVAVYDSAHVLRIYGVRLFTDSILAPTKVTLQFTVLHRVQLDRSVPFPLNLRIVPHPSARLAQAAQASHPSSQLCPPCRILLHRADHTLTEYDPKNCRELTFVPGVDCFWADLYGLSPHQINLLTYDTKGVRLHTITAVPSEAEGPSLPSLSSVVHSSKSPFYFTMLLQDPDPETFPLGAVGGILMQGMEGLSSPLGAATHPTYQVKTKPSLYSHGALLGLVLQSSALYNGLPTPTRRCVSPLAASEAIPSISFPPSASFDGLMAFSDELQPPSPQRELARVLSEDSLLAPPSEASVTPHQFGPPQETQRVPLGIAGAAEGAASAYGLTAPAAGSGSPMHNHHAAVGQDPRQFLSGIMVAIANRLKEGTSFPQCMEYLLHSVLHADDLYEKRPEYCRTAALRLAVEFLRRYHEYYDIIVGCIRKTDLKKWPCLFDVVGSPLVIFDECVETGRTITAAHLLRVLQLPMSVAYNVDRDTLDSEAEETQERAALTCAQEGARRLFPLAVRSYQFQLAVELLRFVGLLTSEIASDLPPPRRRTASQKAGGPFVSDGGQAIMPSAGLTLERAPSEFRISSTSHDADDVRTPTSTPVYVLKSDRLLRFQIETAACEMLAKGELRHLVDLFQTFHLDIHHFLRTHRVGCARVQDLVATFTYLHRDFNLPRCPDPLDLPPLPSPPQQQAGVSEEEMQRRHQQYVRDRNAAMRQHVLRYEMLYKQTLAMLDTGEAAAATEDQCDGSAVMDFAEFLTRTQLHLLVVPSVVAPLTRLQRAFEECGCPEYALLLATLLMRLPTVVSLLQSEAALFQPFVNLLCHKDNLGYCRLHRHLLAMYNTGALYHTRSPSNPTTPLTPNRTELI